MTTSPFPLTLLLLRHGKAADIIGKDFDRPLTEKGINQAHKKGKIIKEHFPNIDNILCSKAVRTTETLHALNINIATQNIFMKEELYLAEADFILKQIHLLDHLDHAKSALIIGHNPGLHQLAYDLLSTAQNQKTMNISQSFPTCALACIKFPFATWQDIRLGTGILSAYYP